MFAAGLKVALPKRPVELKASVAVVPVALAPVVTVRVSEEDVDRVSAIMEGHSPIDLEDESAEELSGQASATVQSDGIPRIRRYVVETSELELEQQPAPKL